jgi:tRNA (guanine37-N1)-methyltransferase
MKLLRRDLRVTGGEILDFPLTRIPIGPERIVLLNELPEGILGEKDFARRPSRPKSLPEALGDRLPSHLLPSLPKSMDVIGAVAIVEIPPELEEVKRLVGEAVLKVNRNVHTVLAKVGPVTGETRVRGYETIAGKEDTETSYKEFGCTYILDPRKVYFSPRLSQERMRVAQGVRNGEAVLDMFAGVGPFSILIARTRRNVTVYAADINPDAVTYLTRNIVLNKAENSVIPLLGDAREIVERSLKGRVDRTIMNLPDRASEYLPTACLALRPEGGVIHHYSFQHGIDALKRAEDEVKTGVEAAGRRVIDVKASRLVRETAPNTWQTAVDALVR